MDFSQETNTRKYILKIYQNTKTISVTLSQSDPEEKKSKYQVLLSPPDFIFGIFENFASTFFVKNWLSPKKNCLEYFSVHFKKLFFGPNRNFSTLVKYFKQKFQTWI